MDKSMKSKTELEREGWQEASISGGAHLKRTVAMYEELGFDVYLEEAKPEDCGGCTVCFGPDKDIMYKIYTRKVEP